MKRQVRMTLEQARKRKSDVDWTKVHATSEEQARQHQVEDGFDPDEEIDPVAWHVAVPPASVREKLGMTQPAFAELIRVPVATVRNWEQGRVIPDAAAKTLLAILWREPEAALRALRGA